MTIKRAACIGGGVIGGAWAARFVLNGVDCTVCDPHPEAERIVCEVMANAERALAMLTDAPLPERGKLTFSTRIEDAVEGVDLVQESVPERLELKQKIHMQIDAAVPEEALVASSTSGLLPTDISAKMMAPERMFVAHPYNPVYLLPLVEIVAGARTAPETIARAHAAYAQLGMKPVTIRKEIDAFVGDRLLEAVWREALWLIRDDVCTVEELDDIMTHSFGLRWAQMGLFQTYRVAGGEAGMRHFIEQFGPTLSLPWTKLMDVPELDEALTEKIAQQSDTQAGDLSIRDLEGIRDDNLVGFLHVLRNARDGDGWSAGRALKEYEDRLRRTEVPRVSETRAFQRDDGAAVRTLLAEAFDNPAEADLVEALRRNGDMVLERVAADGDVLVGHIAYSRLNAPVWAAALAPVSVHPDRQSEGIGGRLIRETLEVLRAKRWEAVFVLGDPNYYTRFGFSADLAKGFNSPYEGENFMAFELVPGALAGKRGNVRHAPAFGELE